MTDPAASRPKPTHYLSGDGETVKVKKRSMGRRLVWLAVTLIGAGVIAGGAAAGVMLTRMDRTPREWAPYLQHRAQGHRAIIVDAADLVARWLIDADRIAPGTPPALPALLGASANRSGVAAAGRLRLVSSLADLRGAVATAMPGDVIQIQPGRYRFEGYPIPFTRSGTAAAAITLRAARLGDVIIESDAVETFKVAAPFWRFENLVMRGVCGDHAYCEHALHVVGPATDTFIGNNRFEDYNAHIKINGEGGAWPDRGVIEGNTFTDTAPRVTSNPITPIDSVGASAWRVSGNIITDFVRGGEGGATYGGFFKGAGEGNVFERNLVVCEWKLSGAPGEHVGLSLGGGGSGPAFMRDQGRTGFEQIGGIIRDNIIAFCSDDGIYVNRSSRSMIDHNTLLDTAGIDVRFIESSATVTANIVDGAIRERDGGELRSWDNAMPLLLGLFAGLHPQRDYFRDPATLDLAWRSPPAVLPGAEPRIDVCGGERSRDALPGAFADYTMCLAGQ